jgi:hypothetical protein
VNAETLYRALITRPITAQRLEKAQARADTPAVWAAVLARITADGRLETTHGG